MSTELGSRYVARGGRPFTGIGETTVSPGGDSSLGIPAVLLSMFRKECNHTGEEKSSKRGVVVWVVAGLIVVGMMLVMGDGGAG